jgi:hypothetical protein
MSDLRKGPCTTYYFREFSNESRYKVAHWDPILAAKAAGFIEEVYIFFFSF